MSVPRKAEPILLKTCSAFLVTMITHGEGCRGLLPKLEAGWKQFSVLRADVKPFLEGGGLAATSTLPRHSHFHLLLVFF